MLYVFQAVPLPIIRSSKLYKHNRVFVDLFMLLTAIVSELELIYYLLVISFLPINKTHKGDSKMHKISKLQKSWNE